MTQTGAPERCDPSGKRSQSCSDRRKAQMGHPRREERSITVFVTGAPIWQPLYFWLAKTGLSVLLAARRALSRWHVSWLITSLSSRIDVERESSGPWRCQRHPHWPSASNVEHGEGGVSEPETGAKLKHQQGRRNEINQCVQCRCAQYQQRVKGEPNAQNTCDCVRLLNEDGSVDCLSEAWLCRASDAPRRHEEKSWNETKTLQVKVLLSCFVSISERYLP